MPAPFNICLLINAIPQALFHKHHKTKTLPPKPFHQLISKNTFLPSDFHLQNSTDSSLQHSTNIIPPSVFHHKYSTDNIQLITFHHLFNTIPLIPCPYDIWHMHVVNNSYFHSKVAIRLRNSIKSVKTLLLFCSKSAPLFIYQ